MTTKLRIIPLYSEPTPEPEPTPEEKFELNMTLIIKGELGSVNATANGQGTIETVWSFSKKD